MITKLAYRNIKKSIQDYSIYFFTLVIAVAIFYVFNALGAQSVMSSFSSATSKILKDIATVLWSLSIFISCVLGFLIIYANNFLIKRRKKEIWLYLILGMSKRKVSTILTLETMMVGCCSLLVGLVLGFGLSQLLSLFIIQLFQADVSTFSFIFSSAALLKTLLYFGCIFLLVMAFNVRNLSKYPLIDLLNANKKNETIPIRNKKLNFFLFFLSLCLFVYAYFLLFSGGVLASLTGVTLWLFAGCGIMGSYLFFLSIAGFSLDVMQKSPSFYFKKLRMFVLRQLNTTINTNVISVTIISLLLLFTICILSGSISIANVYNTNIEQNNVSDFTLHWEFYALEDLKKIDVSPIIADERFQTYVKEYVLYSLYEDEEITLEQVVTPAVKDAIRSQDPTVDFHTKIPLMKKSDFNHLMKLLDKSELNIDMGPQQYLLAANLDQMIAYYQPTLEGALPLTLQGKTLTPAHTNVLVTTLENSTKANNGGVVIVDDSVLVHSEKVKTKVVGNYRDDTPYEKVEEDFTSFIAEKLKNKRTAEVLTTKLTMNVAGAGAGVSISFIGLYIGIIFALCCVTILAIKQLSETSDNQERYQILRELWADEKQIKKSLFVQIGIYFLLPLVAACIHSMLILPEINHLLQREGNLDISKNILLIIGFIVLVYGGYFLATYWCSLNIIKEKRRI